MPSAYTISSCSSPNSDSSYDTLNPASDLANVFVADSIMRRIISDAS